MAEDEPFLSRWSRLKRRPEGKDDEADVRSRDGQPAEPGATRPPEKEAKEPEEPFDLASLPKIEELGAESDIRQFMDARVPSELRQAALRRAWTVDPAIRDFIEIAENQYDWNTPGGLPPGFGPLNLVGGAFETVLAHATGSVPASRPEAAREPGVPAGEESPSDPPSGERKPSDNANVSGEVAPARSADAGGSEGDGETMSAPEEQPRRRHGGALPV